MQAYSVLPVKQNEPTLWADLQTYFADPLAESCTGLDDGATTGPHRSAPDQGKSGVDCLSQSPLAASAAGRRGDAHRHLQGQDHPRSPLPHHRLDASTSVSPPAPPDKPWPLAHREWTALCARCGLRGRSLSPALGQCSSSDGSATQSGDHPHSSPWLCSDRGPQALFCLSS